MIYQNIRQKIITESSETRQSWDGSSSDGGVLQNNPIVDVPNVTGRVRSAWTLGA